MADTFNDFIKDCIRKELPEIIWIGLRKNMIIKIIKAEEWNWYKDEIGAEYVVKDFDKYGKLGIQVALKNNGKNPDVIQHGHYEIVG